MMTMETPMKPMVSQGKSKANHPEIVGLLQSSTVAGKSPNQMGFLGGISKWWIFQQTDGADYLSVISY